MRYLIITMMTMLFLSIPMFAQHERTIVQSFPMKNAVAINLALDGKIMCQEWEKEFIRIRAKITVKNTTDAILKRLITLGRYEMRQTVIDDKITFDTPNLIKKITIGGKLLVEKIEFEVFIPKNIVIEITPPSAPPIM